MQYGARQLGCTKVQVHSYPDEPSHGARCSSAPVVTRAARPHRRAARHREVPQRRAPPPHAPHRLCRPADRILRPRAVGANVDFLPSVRIFLSFLSSLFRAPPRQICEKFLRPVTPCSSFAPFRVRKQGVPHVGPGTVRACRALLEPAGPRGSDGAPPRRG